MTPDQELNQVREALSSYFSSLSDYISGVSLIEPSLDTLYQSIVLDGSITSANNNYTRYSGYKSGALSEAIDRINAIRREINLVQSSSSTIYNSMIGDIDGDSSNWQHFIYRSLNYLNNKDPSQ